MGGLAGPVLRKQTVVPKPVPVWRLTIVALSWLGIQMIWASEYAATTPLFSDEKHLNVGDVGAQAIWAIGPITGLIVGPTVGVLSDRWQSRLGRRRPFIIGGTVCVVAGSLLFSNCENIAGRGSTGAVAIAVFSFWLMDMSINVVQGPLRALLADIVPPEQQGLSQTLASLFQGFGQILGFLNFSYVGGDSPVDKIQLIFFIAYATLAVTVTAACLFAQEEPTDAGREPALRLVDGDDDGDDADGDDGAAPPQSASCVGMLREVWASMSSMPPAMWTVVWVQVGTWMAWFCFNTVLTSWWAVDVMGGESHDCDDNVCTPEEERLNNLYERGTSKGGYAGSMQAGVQLIFSFALPVIMARLGIKTTYIACLASAGAAFFAAFFVGHDQVAAYAVTAVTGIGLAATNVFPFTLVGLIFPPERIGSMMGVLNVFIALPQLVDTTYTGAVTSASSYRYVILIGGFWWILATLAATRLVTTSDAAAGSVNGTPSEPLLGPEGGRRSSVGEDPARETMVSVVV